MGTFDELEALGLALAETQGLRGPAAEAAGRAFARGRDGSEVAARRAWEVVDQDGTGDLSAAVNRAVAVETAVLGVTEAQARTHVQNLVRERHASLGAERTAAFVVEYARRLGGGW